MSVAWRIALYDYCVQVIYALASGNQVILPKDGVADSLGRYIPNKSYFSSDITKVELVHVLLVSKNYANLTNIKNELAKRDSLLTGVMQEADHGYNLHFSNRTHREYKYYCNRWECTVNEYRRQDLTVRTISQ